MKGTGFTGCVKYSNRVQFFYLGTTSQAAETGLIQSESHKKQTAGAKAHHLFCCVCGSQG
jgi:hypothetical protein